MERMAETSSNSSDLFFGNDIAFASVLRGILLIFLDSMRVPRLASGRFLAPSVRPIAMYVVGVLNKLAGERDFRVFGDRADRGRTGVSTSHHLQRQPSSSSSHDSFLRQTSFQQYHLIPRLLYLWRQSYHLTHCCSLGLHSHIPS